MFLFFFYLNSARVKRTRTNLVIRSDWSAKPMSKHKVSEHLDAPSSSLPETQGLPSPAWLLERKSII